MALPDLVVLSHLRWGFVFQRPQHLMSRFARERRVFFFEEPVFDDGPARLDVAESQGVFVATPHLRRGSSASRVLETQRALLDDLVETRRIEAPVLWFYTPMALPFAGHLHARAVIYDCMDELSAFLGAPPELLELERKLLSRADLVFTGGQSLYESKRPLHPAVHAFPSSVDAAHFVQAREGLRDPYDQRALPHPRIGFYGVIDERLDVELVEHVAASRPEWQLVLVGPIAKIDRKKLPRRANIHWIGQRRYEELPAYLAGWNVAMMPFALNEATRFISPTKTLEFLAAGKPVVSTAIRDVVRPYGEKEIVRIAGTHAEFVSAIEAALEEPPEARRARADALVAQTSWERTQSRMAALIVGHGQGRAQAASAQEDSCTTI